MKFSLVVSEPALLEQKDNIADVLGNSSPLDLTNVVNLTVNYNVDLPINKDMLKRLRALVEIAENCSSITLESNEDVFLDYSECMRLMQDLMSISEKKRNAELWND